MKIKDYKCRCGHDDFYLFTPENCIGENHVGIYCSYCGKWFKWADKDEKKLAMNCITKIRNDLIKNGDDLIKRQDAIDACFNGKCANIYDCKEAIEKIPSAQKTRQKGASNVDKAIWTMYENIPHLMCVQPYGDIGRYLTYYAEEGLYLVFDRWYHGFYLVEARNPKDAIDAVNCDKLNYLPKGEE